MAGIEGSAGTTPAAPDPNDIADALLALCDAGFTTGQALGCVEALSGAGLMIARPTTLLNRMVDAAVELDR